MRMVALLRGINVGGNRKVPMLELCTLATKAGLADVKHYINSGNLVFDAHKLKPDQVIALLEKAIKKQFGFHVDVIVRTASEWKKYAAGSPFPDAERARPNFLHLGLSKLQCNKDLSTKLSEQATQGEQIKFLSDAIWVDFVAGVARSKLTPALFDKAAGSPVTMRNWNTVLKLAEMLKGDSGRKTHLTRKDSAKTELPIVSFESVEQWEKWLSSHHQHSSGVWLCFQKKGFDKESLTYAEALDVALCYGWIDGQKQPNDKNTWLQKFTRRRSKSSWSKKNTEHAERLIRAGKMKPAGLTEVNTAKKDGRWKTAYDSPSKATIPEDFLNALGRDKKALAFFNSLNKANLYSIAYRLQTAKKPETRERRMKMILEMMAKGKKFH